MKLHASLERELDRHLAGAGVVSDIPAGCQRGNHAIIRGALGPVNPWRVRVPRNQALEHEVVGEKFVRTIRVGVHRADIVAYEEGTGLRRGCDDNPRLRAGRNGRFGRRPAHQ